MSIGRNSILLFGGRLVNAMSVFGLVILISRMLGPEDFGGYAFLNAVILTGNVIAGFGLDTFMVREVTLNPDEGPRLLSSVLLCKVFTSLAVISIIWGILGLQLKDRVLFQLLLMFSAVVLLNSISQTFWHYGDAFQRFGFHSSLWAFSNLIKVPLVWMLLNLWLDLRMVIYGLVGAEAAAAVVSALVVCRTFQIRFEFTSARSAILLLKRAWLLSIIYAVSALYFRIDLMMLELMKGSVSVGIYAAAYKIIEFLIVIPGTVAMASLPGLAFCYKEDKGEFRKQLLWISLILGVGGALAGAVLFYASENVVGALYGAAFFESALPLKILSIAIVFLFLNAYFSQAAIAANRERSVAAIILVSAVANIVLNLWMIPLYSHVGAAGATLISEVLMVLLFFCVFPARIIQWRSLAAASAERI